MTVFDPTTGEARGEAITLDDLSGDLSRHAADYEAALIEEEAAELAYLYAESVSTLCLADDGTAATTLRHLVKAKCNDELTRLTSAQFASKRCKLLWDTTARNQMAEQSRLKYLGQSDGGAR